MQNLTEITIKDLIVRAKTVTFFIENKRAKLYDNGFSGLPAQNT